MFNTGGFDGTITGLIVDRTGFVPPPVYVSAFSGASSLTTAAPFRLPLALIEFDTNRIAPPAPLPAPRPTHPPLTVPPYASISPTTVIDNDEAITMAPPPLLLESIRRKRYPHRQIRR